MRALCAPPALFSAYAYGVYEDDPDLVRGTHLRLFAGMGASFPLAPFVVFKFKSQIAEPPPVSIHEYEDFLDVTLLPFAGGRFRPVRVTLRDEHMYERIALLDQHNRVVAARNRPPWQFAAPLLHNLRVWGGRADDFRIKAIAVDTENLPTLDPSDATVLGLPVPGRYRWYSGLHDVAAGFERVVRAAPLRLNPMDRPAGPFALTDPYDAVERARLEGVLGMQASIGGGLLRLLGNLVDDPAPPWEQCDAQPFLDEEGKPHYVSAGRLANLQLAAFDPGVARFCGFADLIDDQAALDNEGHWDTLLVVGLFALEPRALLPRRIDLTGLLEHPDPHAGRLLELLVATLKERANDRDWAAELDQTSALARDQGLLVSPFITVAAPVRPWLPPTLAPPVMRDHRWQKATGNVASERYRATLVFPGAPATAICAQALKRDGIWQTRHALLDVDGFEPPQRAQPAILGQTRHLFNQAGLLSDRDLPAEAGAVTYRVHAADYFGRFGPATDFPLEPPPRPLPPPPVLCYQIVPAPLGDPLSPDPLSPGTLKLTVALGQPGAEPFSEREQQLLGAVIVVPRLEDLAAGAYPLASLTLNFNDEPLQLINLTTPGFYDVTLPLPALLPQAKGSWRLRGHFTDTAGNETPPDQRPSLLVEVTDRRPPPVYPSGVGLLWTSAPGPAPEVELTLTWRAAAKSRHRVYLTDRDGLGLSDALIRQLLVAEGMGNAWPEDGTPPSRGLVAAVGCKRVGATPAAVPKGVFRLLTDPPLEADEAGLVVLRTTLPRSLATVQFLRVVPLGPDGAEPPFEQCGIVPVAVPESRRPPAPSLKGTVDPATGFAHLTVSAEGLNLAALASDEPGLFAAGAGGNAPPRFRIRRATGAVAEPIYARPLAERALSLTTQDGATAVFSGTLMDDNEGQGLAPFVPFVYWAEVRLPDERRLPAGWLAEDGGVDALFAVHKQPHPRPFSPSSPPMTLMFVPPDPPAAMSAEALSVVRRQPDALGRVPLTLTLTDPPQSHRKAVGKYRLATWGQWPNERLTPLNGGLPADTWPAVEAGSVAVAMPRPSVGAAVGPLWLRLALVDPVGRFGPFTTLLIEEPALPVPEISPIQISSAIGDSLFAGWQILVPAQPEPLGGYTLGVRVRQNLEPPVSLEGSLDQVPELGLLSLPTVAVNRIVRLAGTQRYVMRLSTRQPLRIEVTLTDPIGQNAKQVGRRG